MNFKLKGLLNYLYLILLPVYFLINEFRVNYFAVKLSTLIICVMVYCIFTLFFAKGFEKIFGSPEKAGLFTFILAGVNLYFGYLAEIFHVLWNVQGNRYLYSLITCLIFLLVSFFFIKKVSFKGNLIGYFLSLGLLVLIVRTFTKFDSYLYKEKAAIINPPKLDACLNCSKPDIYLLIPDGYAGMEELQHIFNFQNKAFYDSLQSREFWVDTKSISNYNVTPYSVASMLNLSFIKWGGKFSNNVNFAKEKITNSAARQFLEKMGYEYYNLSVFPDGQKRYSNLMDPFTVNQFDLLLGNSLTNYVSKSIEEINTEKDDYFYFNNSLLDKIKTSNRNAEEIMLGLSLKKADHPRFIYSHFIMPHFPYLFDRNGVPRPYERLRGANRYSKKDYLEYLEYANGKLLSMIDRIKSNTHGNAIILLVSDHGFRQFNENNELRYQFSNLSAMYLPDKDYAGLREGMSNVNLFRVLFNKQFQQNLSYLKDSCTILNMDFLKAIE